jgi:hypothetical protein
VYVAPSITSPSGWSFNNVSGQAELQFIGISVDRSLQVNSRYGAEQEADNSNGKHE